MFIPSEPLNPPLPSTMSWDIPVARPIGVEEVRARAYELARAEGPDAPFDSVLERAEIIAAFLLSGKAPRTTS